MASSSWAKKTIRLVIDMPGSSSLTIEGLACEVNLEMAGLPDFGKCGVRLAGLSYAHMSRLTMLSFQPLTYRRNVMTIFAGDAGGAPARIFRGDIVNSWADFNASPDPVMVMDCMNGAWGLLMSQSPTAIDGDAPVGRVIEQCAADMGYSFRNEGVTTSLRNAVLNGSPAQKAMAAAEQAGATLLIEDDAMTLLPDKSLRSGATPLISSSTGMIGYPSFTQNGIACKCLFNPNIRMYGGVRIESLVPRASGLWRVSKISHHLSAFQPEPGPWETEFQCSYIWW